MSHRRLSSGKRLALLDRLSPPLLFAVAEIADQTWCYHTDDPGYTTLKYREARLWGDKADVNTYVSNCVAEDERNMREALTQPERYAGCHDWIRSELAKPIGDRYGTPWIEEVRGEATWRSNPDTW